MEQIGIQSVLLGFLLWACVPDIRTRQIPVYLLLLSVGSGLAAECVLHMYPWPVFLGGAACGGIVLLAGWCSKWKIGAADGLLFLACGVFLGMWQVLNLMLWSFLIAAGMAVCLLVRHANRTARMPFAPCICAAQALRFVLLICSIRAG